MGKTTTELMQKRFQSRGEPGSADTAQPEDALDADDVFGDELFTDHLLREQSHPLQDAISAAEGLADPGLVYAALARGDHRSIESLKRQLKMLPATDIGPAERSKLGALSRSLAAGLSGISEGTGEAEKSRTDLGALYATVAGAFSAARVIQEDLQDSEDSYDLQFQALAREDAEEAQDDLSNPSETDISASDAELLQRPDIQEVEIVEEVVDFYTAYTKPKYEVLSSRKLEEEEGG